MIRAGVQRGRRWVVPALVLLGTLVVPTSLLSSSGCSGGCPGFNWADWRAGKTSTERGDDGQTVRQVMADDIERCGTLDGRSREWVEERLGKGSPARRPKKRLSKISSELLRDLWRHPSVSYTLGLCTKQRNCMFRGETEFLEVRYESYAPNAQVRSVDVFGT